VKHKLEVPTGNKQQFMTLPEVCDGAYVGRLCANYPGLGAHEALLNKCHAVWRTVEEKKEFGSLEALAGGKVVDIPFVSTLNLDDISERFLFSKTNSLGCCVQTLCRSDSLLESIAKAVAGHSKIFLWGTRGGGKSHLMNAFAFLKFCEHLVDRKKPRVLWLPHLGKFAEELSMHLFEGLVLAFLDKPEALLELVKLKERYDALKCWAREHELLLVADNHNALEELSPKTSAKEDQRAEARIFVSSFNSTAVGSRVLFCASADQRSVDLAAATQDGTRKISIFGGWTRHDLQTLAHHKYPHIKAADEEYGGAKQAYDADHENADNLQTFENAKCKAVLWDNLLDESEEPQVIERGLMDATGGLALDVDSVLKSYDLLLREQPSKVDFAEHLADWRNEKAAEVKGHMTKFLTALAGEERKKLAWKYLHAAATQRVLNATADPHLIDCTYFYPKATQGSFLWTELFPTSNVVRFAALEMWLEWQQACEKGNWKQALIDLLPGRINKSAAGFIDEKIVLTIIEHVDIAFTTTRPADTAGKKAGKREELAVKLSVGKAILFGDKQWKPSSTPPAAAIHNLSQQAREQTDKQKWLQLNPELWNYTAADSVIIGLVEKDSPPVMIEVQVTYEKPSHAKKAKKTASFFTTNHWEKFAFDDKPSWTKVLLWISSSDTLPELTDKKIFQGHLSFRKVFLLGGIDYTIP
jgi:hypothetical protein